MDQLPRLGKRELICLLSFTCNYVVFVWRGFLFLWVLGMGYVILLWHSLSLPYNYFGVGVSCRNLYSFVVYLYVNGSGSITSVGEERANLSAAVYLLLCGFCLERFPLPLGAWDGLRYFLWHSLSLYYNYFL